jgi:hypothetical protein
MEHRLGAHIATRFEATIYCPSSGKRAVTVQNLSAGGMLIHAPALRLTANMQLSVEFDIAENGESRRYVVDALVVRHVPDGAALMFDLDVADFTKLYAALYLDRPPVTT